MKQMLLGIALLLFSLTACGTAAGIRGEIPLDAGNDFVEESQLELSSLSVFEKTPAKAVYPLVTESPEISIAYPSDLRQDSEGTLALMAALEHTTGIRVNLQLLPAQDYITGLQTQEASGTVSDLIMAAPDFMLQTERTNWLLPLDDLIAEYGPNYIEAVKKCYDGVQSLVTDEDNIMRLFRFFDTPQLTPDIGVVLRQDWLDALGLEPPETYGDYHELLLAIKNTYNPALPFRMLPAGITPGDNFTAGFGVSLGSITANEGFFQEDGVVKFGALEPGFSEYVTTMRQWYEEGLITLAYRDEADIYTNSYLIDLSVGGSGVFFLPLASYAALSAMCDFPIRAAMDPVQSSGDQTHLAPSRATSLYAPGFSIAVACDNPELAMQVADWFYSDEALLIGNFGLEGVTYTLEENTPAYTDIIRNNPQGLSQSDAVLRYTTDLQGVIYETHRQYLLHDQMDVLNTWSRQKDSANMLPNGLRFTFKEGEAYSAIMADINSYLDGAIAQLISGDMPLSEIPAVQERLTALNINRAIALKQTALDRTDK